MALVVAVPVVALLASACDYRKNPLVRAAFYPPTVDMRPRAVRNSEPQANVPGNTFDHALYARVLRLCVTKNGMVRYGTVAKHEGDLDRYLDELRRAAPESLSRKEQLALYLNAYNAFTLKLMLQHPGARAIREIPEKERWLKPVWQIGKRTISLDQLEHAIIRPQFRDPRVHFALVCASAGCPPLQNVPYNGRELDSQLDQQARVFFSRAENLRWNRENQTLELTELMDWFAGDFESNAGSLSAFVRRYVPEGMAREIATAGSRLRIRFMPYDWRLNGSRAE